MVVPVVPVVVVVVEVEVPNVLVVLMKLVTATVLGRPYVGADDVVLGLGLLMLVVPVPMSGAEEVSVPNDLVVEKALMCLVVVPVPLLKS